MITPRCCGASRLIALRAVPRFSPFRGLTDVFSFSREAWLLPASLHPGKQSGVVGHVF